jgi:hypothetical protein
MEDIRLASVSLRPLEPREPSASDVLIRLLFHELVSETMPLKRKRHDALAMYDT